MSISEKENKEKKIYLKNIRWKKDISRDMAELSKIK